MNSTGVSEPIVQTQGTDRVVVELPGVTDKDDIETLVGQTGRLDFVPLPPAEYGTYTNAGSKQAVQGQPLRPRTAALQRRPDLRARTPPRTRTGQRAVGFTLKDRAPSSSPTTSSAHVGEYFAIVLDGKVVSAPRIQSAITDGQGIITGGGIGGFAART